LKGFEMALSGVGGGYQIGDGNLNEVKTGSMAAVKTATDTATLTVAQTLGNVIVATPTAAATFTLPTVSDVEAVLVNAKVGMTFDLSIINLATTDAFDITVAAGTGWTLVGNVAVEAKSSISVNSSGLFRARKTAATTWTMYRIA
jgi:hypothetical protein